MQEQWKPTSWNRHPWNRKAKELLDQMDKGIFPEGLYVPQLAEWGIENLPEYQKTTRIPPFPHQPRDSLQSDLSNPINDLMNYHSPKQAMEFMLETPWDSEDAPRPYVEEFQKLETPEEGAEQILENLTERMRWWTAIPD